MATHRPVLVTPPEAPPVTLEEVKAALNVTHNDDDERLKAEINAAVAHYEGWSGILGGVVLAAQSWRQDFDEIREKMGIPLRPVRSVTTVEWRDKAGTVSTIAKENYTLVTDAGGRSYVRFNDAYDLPFYLNEVAGASITYAAGYETVPQDIKSAIIFRVQLHYDEAASSDGQNLERIERDLIAKYRPPGI